MIQNLSHVPFLFVRNLFQFLEKLANDGAVPSTLVGADFAAFMAGERTRWGEVVAAADISVE